MFRLLKKCCIALFAMGMVAMFAAEKDLKLGVYIYDYAFRRIAQENGVILGRTPEDAAFTIEDASISRHHIRLHLDEYGLVVSDLGSTNGTAVNGIILTPFDNNRTLNDGDTLSMGNIQLQVEFM